MRVRGHDGATRADRDRKRHEQPAYGSGRFLYDDGHTTSCQAAVGKTQGVRRVGGCGAAGTHAASRIRQEYYVTLFREGYTVAATVRKLLGTKLYGLTRVKTKVG